MKYVKSHRIAKSKLHFLIGMHFFDCQKKWVFFWLPIKNVFLIIIPISISINTEPEKLREPSTQFYHIYGWKVIRPQEGNGNEKKKKKRKKKKKEEIVKSNRVTYSVRVSKKKLSYRYVYSYWNVTRKQSFT